MFPTTVWTRIHDAGADDEAALQEFGLRYRPVVLQYLQRRGFDRALAEDLCQDVFVRVLRGGVLAKADRTRGRFRSLLLAVTMRTIQDHLRRRREVPMEFVDGIDDGQDFDHAWALHLTERALETLREQGSPYFHVLTDHLSGQRQDRQRLWIARRKLADLVRQEIAGTCATRADFEEELAHLATYLRGR